MSDTEPQDAAEAEAIIAGLAGTLATGDTVEAALTLATSNARQFASTVDRAHPDWAAGSAPHRDALDAAKADADVVDAALAQRLRCWALFPEIDPRPVSYRAAPVKERREFRFVREYLG